jgi:hypothetical protein
MTVLYDIISILHMDNFSLMFKFTELVSAHAQSSCRGALGRAHVPKERVVGGRGAEYGSPHGEGLGCHHYEHVMADYYLPRIYKVQRVFCIFQLTPNSTWGQIFITLPISEMKKLGISDLLKIQA